MKAVRQCFSLIFFRSTNLTPEFSSLTLLFLFPLLSPYRAGQRLCELRLLPLPQRCQKKLLETEAQATPSSLLPSSFARRPSIHSSFFQSNDLDRRGPRRAPARVRSGPPGARPGRRRGGEGGCGEGVGRAGGEGQGEKTIWRRRRKKTRSAVVALPARARPFFLDPSTSPFKHLQNQTPKPPQNSSSASSSRSATRSRGSTTSRTAPSSSTST
jgi:hypothetical protein